MADPTQEDVVRELYNRRDSLPADKQAVINELAGRFNISDQDYSGSAPMSVKGVAKAFLKQTPGGLAAMGGITGGPLGAAAGAAFGQAAKNIAPDTFGDPGTPTHQVVDAAKDTAVYGLVPAGISKLVQRFGPAAGTVVSKTLGNMLPQEGRVASALNAVKGAYRSAVNTVEGKLYSAEPPFVPKQPTTSPTAGPAPSVDATPIPPPAGYVRKSPIDLGEFPTPSKVVRKPAARVEPISQEAADVSPIPPPEGKLPSGRKPGGIQNQTNAPASDEYVMQEDGKRLMKKGTEDPADIPAGEAPVKAPRVRSTPAAQKRADEIAALTRHADTIPLAQEAITEGVTSKQLLALDSAQRNQFMKGLGMEGRSEETWRTLVGHIQRLEKLAAKAKK